MPHDSVAKNHNTRISRPERRPWAVMAGASSRLVVGHSGEGSPNRSRKLNLEEA